jgi:hypothetical protein
MLASLPVCYHSILQIASAMIFWFLIIHFVYSDIHFIAKFYFLITTIPFLLESMILSLLNSILHLLAKWEYKIHKKKSWLFPLALFSFVLL